ncbi:MULTISPECIES: hypothetical protein [Actinoallomurus]|jgi:hypothetical protein|nr:hypothetical protein [Actinoallomurus sp. NBC_01490]
MFPFLAEVSGAPSGAPSDEKNLPMSAARYDLVLLWFIGIIGDEGQS